MVVNVFSTSVNSANISRHDLLAWVNTCLQSNLSKIEDMSTGAAYCQLTDILFRGFIPLKKVRFNSRTPVDHLNNWQLLTKTWQKLGVNKTVPVDALMKAKFQDNFEFLQWFHKFFEANYDGKEYYNPLEARANEEFPINGNRLNRQTIGITSTTARLSTDPATRKNMSTTSSRASTCTATARRTSASSVTRLTTIKHLDTTIAPRDPYGVRRPMKQAVVSNRRTQMNQSNERRSIPKPIAHIDRNTNLIVERNDEELKKLKAEVKELRQQMALFGETLASMEKERNFYFGKLMNIERLCSEVGEGSSLSCKSVLNILYELEEGFVPASEIEDPSPKDEMNSTIVLEPSTPLDVTQESFATAFDATPLITRSATKINMPLPNIDLMDVRVPQSPY